MGDSGHLIKINYGTNSVNDVRLGKVQVNKKCHMIRNSVELSEIRRHVNVDLI